MNLLHPLVCGPLLALWSTLTIPAQEAPAPKPPPPGPTANDGVGADLLELGGKLKFQLDARYRYENWSFFDDPSLPPTADDSDYDFHALRTIASVSYEKDAWLAQLAGLDVRLWSLPDTASGGPGQLYFSNSGRSDGPSSLNFWHTFVQWTPDDAKEWRLRLGRQAFADGAFAPAEGAKWNRLRGMTVSERLVGTFGWSNGGRTYDGFRVDHESKGWFGQGYAGRVNAGGFDIDDAGKGLDDYYVGGLEVTARPGRIVEDLELRAFGLWANDDRQVTRAQVGDEIEVYTLGLSAVGVTPVGSGQGDAFLWLAGQLGDLGTRDQQAYALIAELGWQATEAAWQPWLRGGFAWASGDDDPTDGTAKSFFNIVPTNHKYYGYADQVAFSNVQDLYLQLFLHPGKSVGIEVAGHVFRAADASSPIVFGSGAFSNQSFGYGTRATGGSSDIGEELDIVVTWKPTSNLDAQVGWAHFFGGRIYESLFTDSDVDFFYVQTGIRF